jgi:hypothetical protein
LAGQKRQHGMWPKNDPNQRKRLDNAVSIGILGTEQVFELAHVQDQSRHGRVCRALVNRSFFEGSRIVADVPSTT